MTATVCGPCDDAFQDTNTREPFENDDATKGEPWDEASGDGFDDVFQSEDRLGEAMFDAPQTDPDSLAGPAPTEVSQVPGSRPSRKSRSASRRHRSRP